MSHMDHAMDLAKELAGNHRAFACFAWWSRPDDDARWCLVYTHNRDSDCLDESNAHVIGQAMAPFLEGDDPDARAEEHSHWAVGWVAGYAIRVYAADGSLTPAFLAYAELHAAMVDYPVLDEKDFSEREQEAAQRVWADCFSDRERLAYMHDHWSQFEHCHARWYPAEEAWRNLLDCVRGRVFFGYASELLS